jgi:hypothetical protein
VRHRTERFGAVVGRWSGISHGAVLRSGDGFSVQWTLLLDTSPSLRARRDDAAGVLEAEPRSEIRMSPTRLVTPCPDACRTSLPPRAQCGQGRPRTRGRLHLRDTARPPGARPGDTMRAYTLQWLGMDLRALARHVLCAPRCFVRRTMDVGRRWRGKGNRRPF